MALIWDIETNNLLGPKLHTLHCIAILDTEADVLTPRLYGPDEVEEGIRLLMAADEIIGHNIINFDIPALKQLYPWFSTDGLKVTDTLVLSRLIRSDLKNDDYTAGYTQEQLPRKLHGSHSLKAWGMRLGEHKGEFGAEGWDEYTPEMGVYCQQDVVVTHELWTQLAPHEWSQNAIEFEHDIAKICNEIGQAGWTFDIDKAQILHSKLSAEKIQIEQDLQNLFPSWVVEEEFIPKVNNKTRGYEKGVPFIKKNVIYFNPNSRRHIEHCLRTKYDWQPTEFTPSGEAKVDETVLSQLPYPEAQKLARSFMLQKRLGMLADGNNAWLKLVDEDGKLRHTINPLGTVTGRASSFGPNLQQVPAVRAEFGRECRELFTVPEGYQLVGADLSGIELRCLANFLQDGGKYADIIMQGDIHQANADMAGISRDEAKTMIYALCYSAGDQRLGEILGKGASEGKQLRDNFFKANPAFPKLLSQLKRVVQSRGYLHGLDGRRLHVRGHAHLNVLLQSAGALIAKKWVQLIHQEINKQQLDATIIAWVHDEVQIAVKPKEADHVGRITGRMAQEAGKHFKFSIPIDAEYGVGRHWADTH